MYKKIVKVLLSGAVVATGCTFFLKLQKNKNDSYEKKITKFKSYYDILNSWIIMKQKNKDIYEYLKSRNYETVAIYGMGELGKRLYDDLQQIDIEVKFVIDQNIDALYFDIEKRLPDDNMDGVDAIIVTPVFQFEEIKEKLRDNTNADIINIKDVVEESI